MRRLRHWWRTRGHDTADLNCIHWTMWTARRRSPVCGPCEASGGYVALRHAQIDRA